jgi:hypothetical protein
MKINNLFEYLRKTVGCEYESDLQFGNNRIVAIRILKDIPKENVKHYQYTDACRYFGIVN